MKTFIVLGMHRSATSLTAKALSNEIDMGAEYEPMPDQPYGNWEDKEFIELNDEILAMCGGSWCDPPPREKILKTDLVHAAGELVKSRNEKGVLWGWKDPRTTLTIELYEPYLVNPHYICNFRDPLEVAKSLQKRNGFSIEKGIELAGIYNQRLIEFLTKRYL